MIRIAIALLVQIRSKILDQNTITMNDQEVIMNAFKHSFGPKIGPSRMYLDHKYGPYYMIHCKMPYSVILLISLLVVEIQI